MKAYLIALIFVGSILCATETQCQPPGKPMVPASTIIKDMNSLMAYYGDHLNLNGDFTAYNEHGHSIPKTQFLKAVCTGNYLPLQLYSTNQLRAYQLYKLNDKTSSDVVSMLKQIGVTYYGFDLMVGKKFPAFHYMDLKGNVYTPENIKGKIVVLKAWFISCVPCVAEMPMLNKLTEEYKNRKDIVFVSLATDSKKALEGFMKRKEFKYAVVPAKAAYIQETLHATGYPCHWIINKQGVVVSMSYDHNEMIAALRKEAQQ